MAVQRYFFQKEKRAFAKRFFKKGLNVPVYVLFALKELGEATLESFPDSYPEFKLMKQVFGVGKYQSPAFQRGTIRVNFHRLRSQGLIARDAKRKIYYLTDQGEEFVAYIKDRYETLRLPWDGKLRMLIFDIPEEKKEYRKWLRYELELIQFRPFQKSVYIGKHPLPQSLYKEIVEAGLNQHVCIFTVAEINRKKEILEILEKEE